MAGATRHKARVSVGNEPPIAQGSGVAPDGVSSAGGSAASTSASGNATSDSRDNVSRLSEGLEPMHLSDAARKSEGIVDDITLTTCLALDEQLHAAAGELNRLGLHVKDIISTIQRLEGLGLRQQDIPLPKIIVLGKLPVQSHPRCSSTNTPRRAIHGQVFRN